MPNREVSLRLDGGAVEALDLGKGWQADVRRRLALSCYAGGLVSLGWAERLAGLGQAAFLLYLHEQRVPVNHGPAELAEAGLVAVR